MHLLYLYSICLEETRSNSFNSLSTFVSCWYNLQTFWTQIRPNRKSAWFGFEPFGTLMGYYSEIEFQERRFWKIIDKQHRKKACKQRFGDFLISLMRFNNNCTIYSLHSCDDFFRLILIIANAFGPGPRPTIGRTWFGTLFYTMGYVWNNIYSMDKNQGRHARIQKVLSEGSNSEKFFWGERRFLIEDLTWLLMFYWIY